MFVLIQSHRVDLSIHCFASYLHVFAIHTGHARNLLIPRKIAVYATLDNKEQYANIINTEHIKDIVKKHDKLQELSNEPLIMERLLDPGMCLFSCLVSNYDLSIDMRLAYDIT